MELDQLATAAGYVGVFGAAILALIRYLTADQPYRGAIEIQREQIAQLAESLKASRRIEQELRVEIGKLRDHLDEAADREDELLGRVRDLDERLARLANDTGTS